MELTTGGTAAGKFWLFLMFLAMELATGGTATGKFGLFLLILAMELATGGMAAGKHEAKEKELSQFSFETPPSGPVKYRYVLKCDHGKQDIGT